jgi:hypothetical protein
MLENNEGAIKNGQSRETGNIGYEKNTSQRQTKQKTTTQYLLDIHFANEDFTTGLLFLYIIIMIALFCAFIVLSKRGT